MKYKCDMIKDLMPLLIDKSATEASERAVIEHMSECSGCEKYYALLSKDIVIGTDRGELENRYVLLAKKLRKRNIIMRLLVIILLSASVFLSINYAEGYRIDPQKAADISGRLNYKSKVLGYYEWEDKNFYIYDSYSCYDVVLVDRTWHGWKVTDTCLSWPKWYDENAGIEMAGYLYHWSDNKGIQLFSFIVRDDRVEKVEVTVFNETKEADVVNTDELILLTFENTNMDIDNTAAATAYDADGKPLYKLEEQKGYWTWVPIE